MAPKKQKPEPVSEPAATPPPPAPAFGDVLPPWLQLPWLLPLTGEQRVALALVALAGFLFLPWLGAVGLWDPWEPHYGEAARSMIDRGDYIHAWWEKDWFFSKPALDLWLMAAGMIAAGVHGPARGIGVYTEWAVRLPFAAIAVLGAVLLFVAASRLVGRRPAIFGTVALLTTPLMAFMARQAVPDPVFVGLVTAAMACLMIVLFERDDLGPAQSGRDGWLIAFYALVGLATLSKGLLGFCLPGAVALVYFVATGEWHRLRRLRLFLGALIVLAICAPWYATLIAFDGRDDEGRTFFQRFIIHDHFQRIAAGVHTTTPGGSFVYFIEQVGFDCFPWVFALPGAASVSARVAVRPRTPRERALFFALLWALVGFAVFAFSATKFHHYAFPALPPLLLLCGVWLDQLLEDGLRAHAGELLVGGLLYGLVAQNLAMAPKHLTDLFVYNYERPYPDREVNPRGTFTLLFFAAPAVALSPWLFDRLAQLWGAAKAIWSKAARAGLRAALRARLDGETPASPESHGDRVLVTASLVLLALALATYLGWSYWTRMSVHWTQRDLFWAYHQDSTPDEPIAAYLMNWRGETLYSRNTVRQIRDVSRLHEFVQGPGKRKWILVEQGRLSGMRQVLGATARVRVVESKNSKFVLTAVEAVPPVPQQSAPQPPR